MGERTKDAIQAVVWAVRDLAEAAMKERLGDYAYYATPTTRPAEALEESITALVKAVEHDREVPHD